MASITKSYFIRTSGILAGISRLKYVLGIVFFMMISSCTYIPEEPNVREIENFVLENSSYIQLGPTESSVDTAFIFVPGALVDPHAYLCWLDLLSYQKPGMTIISLKFASNLAISRPGKVLKVIDEFPEIGTWYICGHSLGGVVAAMAVDKKPGLFDGLILLGSWSGNYADLSGWEGKILNIYASADSFATPAEVEENMVYASEPLLWDTISVGESVYGSTCYYQIEGGNHSGFGCYGQQQGDGVSTITTEYHQELMLQAITKFIELP